MLSQDSLERATSQAGISSRPRFLETTASTNADALAAAEEGAAEWTVVAAGHQSAGRGRLGRSWADAPGTALLFSVVLRPPVPPAAAAAISLLAAVEMGRAARPAPVVAKWPNDLLVGEKKVGGILPEARVRAGSIEHLVLGIGVNVTTAPDDLPPDVREVATGLAAEGGPADPATLLAAFLTGFRNAYRPWEPGFVGRVVGEYAKVCATIGRRVRVTTTSGRTVEGVATGVDERGALVVAAGGRTEPVAFGEVAHLG
ncbi:MAG: biotin--[acetyl-CoA-carboxylase] ligase [Actinomycetota bacterium]